MNERKGPVPHFKCMTCKARLHSPAGSADLLDEPCPSCGSPLERPGNLSELVGFRAITWHDRPADGGSASARPSLVDRLGALYGHPALGEARLSAEAVAMPRPETTC